MARLARPYIPLSIRVQVAERQVDAAIFSLGSFDPETDVRSRSLAVFRDFVDRESWKSMTSLGRQLSFLLRLVFGDAKVELHHRPALLNREWIHRKNDYDPPANSPDHLVYLLEGDHDVETRIHGVGAQRSDLSQARYLKKVARNRETKPEASRFPKQPSCVKRTTDAAAKLRQPKQKWPKRPFPKRIKR